jgi:chromosomal replication initiation ATPase DnaA
MKREDVDRWCSDNKYILICTKKTHLTENEVLNIIENVCGIKMINGSNRNMYKVFGRYLFYYYFDTFTHQSNGKIGASFNLDQATVINGLNKVDGDEILTGWRKEFKSQFRNEINKAHKLIDIKARFE